MSYLVTDYKKKKKSHIFYIYEHALLLLLLFIKFSLLKISKAAT